MIPFWIKYKNIWNFSRAATGDALINHPSLISFFAKVILVALLNNLKNHLEVRQICLINLLMNSLV